MLNKKEMDFLLSILKTLLAKLGTKNEAIEILNKNRKKSPVKPIRRSNREYEERAKKLVFINAENPIVDYGRPKSMMGG